ncbi:hypothetical protein [Bacillus sp. EB600]|uniref:hypothetical protein n=1 Tax=Bacillus sp. EB600 TaxID=2806345 RepID=UPI002109275B|nr:hypothetical protein [Bacillus sp. EB600]MCQ6282521.1 hypothetical protein [Bacillus sp. EB600]
MKMVWIHSYFKNLSLKDPVGLKEEEAAAVLAVGEVRAVPVAVAEVRVVRVEAAQDPVVVRVVYL